jgi:hypothetical protein
MDKLRKKLGKAMLKTFEELYSEYGEDYDRFLDSLNTFKLILEEKEVSFDEICLAFKPKVVTPLETTQEDEDGNPLEEILEIPRSDEPLTKVIKKRGWVTPNVEEKIKSSLYFKLLKKNIKLTAPVFEDVTLNGFNILGRSNNPSNWGNDKQGLVMGMVQSGKTVSMLNLMSMGMSTGYNLFILLAGGKESLRLQSQERIRDAFSLIHAGQYYDQPNGIIIYSPTDSQGYSAIPGSYLDIFRPNDIPKPIIVITILKESNNLKRLNRDVLDLKDFCEHEKINFNHRYTTMILDDESDYASLDISDINIKGIHEQLVKLRENLGKSCYIGYTATPQGCLASDPSSTIGYPKDFIWLLETMKQPGDPRSSLTYMGLNEFFIQYEGMLINTLSKEVWPHHQKKPNGVSAGIYDPIANAVIKNGNLNILEEKCANEILERRKPMPKEFIAAIIDFILGCGIRWYRYYNSKPAKGFPTLDDVQSDYPYHAMMFNLSLTKKNHVQTVKVIESCLIKAEAEFLKWENKKPSFFDDIWNHQVRKTSFLKTFNDFENKKDDIIKFVTLAFQIVKRPIPGGSGGNFVYKLNSDNEGDVLNYSGRDLRKRTKKCAIFNGGNILSRGLTIENLSVSIFIRSQAASLLDTNLQMCRWFGHKKNHIDLLSLYIMDPLRSLFKDISKCDNALRLNIKSSIISNLSPDKIMIELWSSNLFKVTSPKKARSLVKQKGSAVSFSGRAVDLREPFCSGNVSIIKQNLSLFEKYLDQIKCAKIQKNHLNRGDLFLDVDFEQFLNFFQSLKINKDALYVSPGTYADFLVDWYEGYMKGHVRTQLPKINIGFLRGYQTRKSATRQREFEKKPTNKSEAIQFMEDRIGAVLGGTQKRAKVKYKGDRFYDKSLKWHQDNIDREIGPRLSNDSILLLFYKINPNYLIRLSRGNVISLKRGDKGFIDAKEVLTFAAITPFGGPSYQVQTNKLISI